MGGVGGTYNLMGDSGASTSSPVSQEGLAGSRAALPEAATGTPATDADFSTWLASVMGATQGIPAASPTNAGNPLIANPTEAAAPPGFQHSPYPEAPTAGIEHIGAAVPVAPKADETPKEFAAPTTFANPWDAMIGANAKVAGKGLFYSDQNWDKNPAAVQEWLQAYADAGGDYRKQDKYYNTVSPGAGMKIYWPGDPARK